MQQYRKNLGKVSLTAEGPWDRKESYEILSIVYEEHTQHGFISRKEVPIGVDINNKEYWMPFNVSGYADNNTIILNQKESETTIKSYTLEEAIKSIASVGRKPGTILGFYNENTDRLDIGGRWELWQYNGVDIADWENVNSWDSIYYNYNKFAGWYRSEESLKKYIPFPEIGCYAYVGNDLNEAVIYRCDRKYVWTNTTEHVWDYIKVIVGGNVTVGENGNWFNNGVDTNIPASIKGENGKTPIIRNNNNVLEVSYDNVTWTKVSDEMAAWFRINNNKLEMSRHEAGGWEVMSDYIAAWFRWQSQGGQQAFSTGKIQITRDGVTWTDLSGEFVNNLRISRYIGTDESLPTSGIAEGTIYAKGPTYADEDTSHSNPIYRLWVYAWKGNTLAWQDNGEFQSIAAGVVQETGNSETEVMSQKAVTDKLSELGSQVIYDVSVNNDGATFASLSVLLSSENLSTLIPTAVRCGGMNIRFVQSSDNKYVQYRLVANSWSTNTENWAIAEEGVYVENPEFVYVKTDTEGKILWAIRTDGSIYYGAGVPQQIIDYIEEKIADLSLDEYEDIVAFLSDLEKGDKTLQTLLDEKVDKEEGKSLIDTEYAEGVHYVENPEFAEVKLDNEDKILEATEKDGTKLFGGNVKILGSIDISGLNYKVVSNPEWLEVVLDSEDRIICGIKTNGKFVVYIADFLDDIEAIKARLEELDAYSVAENPEFMDVELDANDKVLSGRKVDGTKFENNDVELNGNVTVGGSLEVDGVVIKNIEDPEGRYEITLDFEEKIVSYRKEEGTKVENIGFESPKITTNSLNLSESGMTEFQQALKDSGFRPGGGGDWSEREVIELPEPASCALLNLIVDSLPINNSDVSEGYAEYYDKAGNYFKLPVSLEAQGQTSRIFARTGGKGNYTADFPTDIKFGSWVPQDSFHLKGCAKDVVRGILPTSYKWAYMFMNYLDAKPNRVLLKDTSKTTTTHASGDRFTDWGDGARCLPDGFPVEVYINGEYWGLYSWQLKKHRKNYSMDKKDYTSLFLDADNFSNFWLGNIPWNKIDIKGPKDLVCMDGSAFDGDHPKELIDDTSEYYDGSDKKHKGSATTKTIIKTFPAKYLEIKALVDTGTSEALAEAKTLFAEYFDVNACMLVYVYNCLMKNNDSIYKNTLWGTWKNGKIAPMLWDLDGMYGEGWIGNGAIAPSAYLWTGSYATSPWPLALFWRLYQTEIGTTYENLRRDGVISIQTWHSIMSAWIDRIGVECYKRDIEKWPETPSYRENYTNSDYWEERTTTNNIGNIQLWNSENSYNQGDEVALKTWPEYDWYIIYTAKQASDAANPQCPVTKFYEKFPLIGGYYNSLTRMRKWMEEQIALCDSVFNYN